MKEELLPPNQKARGSYLKRYLLLLIISIFLTSCSETSQADLAEALMNEEGKILLGDNIYIFCSSAAGLKKDEKLAVVTNKDGNDVVYSIQGINSEEWVMVVREVIMGDWVLYRNENVDFIPIELSNKTIYNKFSEQIEYADNIYQLYACIPDNDEIEKEIGKLIIEGNEYILYSIINQDAFEWIVLMESSSEKSLLYRNISVDFIPIYYYEFARNTYKDKNGVYHFYTGE